jgi:hypothetical protein
VSKAALKFPALIPDMQEFVCEQRENMPVSTLDVELQKFFKAFLSKLDMVLE